MRPAKEGWLYHRKSLLTYVSPTLIWNVFRTLTPEPATEDRSTEFCRARLPICHRPIRMEVALLRLGLERVPGRLGLVHFYAQSRAGRDRGVTVNRRHRVPHYLIAPGHIARDALLDH